MFFPQWFGLIICLFIWLIIGLTVFSEFNIFWTFQTRGSVNSKAELSSHQHCSTLDFRDVIKAGRSRLAPGSRALVTGACGFIGSHVADFVLNELRIGKVVAVDDLSGGFPRNSEKFVSGGGVLVLGDIKNVTFVKELYSTHGPFDFVYHIAAYAAEGLSHFIRHYNYENNLLGSVNLLNAALSQPVLPSAFIFTSSIAAYGASDGVPPFTELSPKTPEDPYGIAKMAFELDLKAAHHMFGLNYIIFRPHNVYGPRQNIADKFRNAVGIFMNQILRNESVTIFGDGNQKRAFSYISDVADIIGASVFFEHAHNNDFFVGNDKEYSINQLARAVITAMGATPPSGGAVQVTHLESRKEVTDAFPFHGKLRCVFNPPPTIDLQEGLQRTADYVKKHGSFSPTGYKNIEVPKNLPPSWSAWLNNSEPP